MSEVKMLSSRDIAESLRIDIKNARILMNEMDPINVAPIGSTNKLLRVTEEAFLRWVKGRMPGRRRGKC